MGPAVRSPAGGRQRLICHSRESGNPVALLFGAKADPRSWIPAFAGMTEEGPRKLCHCALRPAPNAHGGWRLRQPPLRRGGEAAPVRAWRPSRRGSTMARTTSVPLIVREERREAGPYASIPFGSPRKAEAFRGSPWIGVSKPKLRGASPGSPPGAEAPWRFTLDPCFGRGRCSSPMDCC